MYKQGFVMCILHSGEVMEEVDRKVTLPFHSEYKVRLKNKNSKNSAADVFVNGEKISRFRLNAGETLDIERYLDGNNDKGKRFQFVPLSDSRVENPSNFENGVVEAHFYLEKNAPTRIIEEHHHHHHHDHYPWPYYPRPWEPYITWTSDSNTLQYDSSSVESLCSVDASVKSVRSAEGDAGATVRGSESKQKFISVPEMTLEPTPIVLKLKLVSGGVRRSTEYCTNCGKKRLPLANYCPKCGRKFN